jgi:RecB family endonuclease NucS
LSKRVFVASASGLEPGTLVEMTAAFKERQDLQEWLLHGPEIIEAEFYVLTSEFDKWQTPQGEKQSDRLYILGIDGDGRLVVVELKRGACPDTTDMQAFKYAALSSQFTVRTLLEAHRVNIYSDRARR